MGAEVVKTVIDPTECGNVGCARPPSSRPCIRHSTITRLSRRFISTIASPFSAQELGADLTMSRNADHACPPLTNLVVLPIRPTGSFVPLAALFAVRDVRSNEELTFDYGDAGGEGWFFRRDEGRQEGDKRRGDDEQMEGTKCLCGSERCRGFMPFDVTL